VNFITDPAKSHIDGRIGKSAMGTSTADATCAHAFGNPVCPQPTHRIVIESVGR
jgi:hypothetical protein